MRMVSEANFSRFMVLVVGLNVVVMVVMAVIMIVICARNGIVAFSAPWLTAG